MSTDEPRHDDATEPLRETDPTEPLRETDPTEPPRALPAPPSGPHAPTVLLALICLVVAGLAVARQVVGYVGLPWSGSGPVIIIATGLVLLAIGVLGIVRERRDTGEQGP
jgi:hypothetical protein